jgi:transcriptional regulator with XRE-family HTH domain
MKNVLNTDLLASMLRTKRGSKGLRQVAEEIGHVSAPTLSRIEQGNVPDVDTFIRLCQWLNEKAETFMTTDESKQEHAVDTKQKIVAHLRADRQLKPDTVEMLIKVIDFAYSQPRG